MDVLPLALIRVVSFIATLFPSSLESETTLVSARPEVPLQVPVFDPCAFLSIKAGSLQKNLSFQCPVGILIMLRFHLLLLDLQFVPVDLGLLIKVT